MKHWEVLRKQKISSSKTGHFSDEEIIKILLENRNIISDSEQKEFINPRLDSVTIESVGIDKKHLSKGLSRIKKAIEEKERIIVFGDYDVDGITGTAIVWETLHEMTDTVLPYIPNRIEEGYGLSVKGIENLLSVYPDTKVIITVDNGIVANEAVDYANTQGIDVIITDHHMPREGDSVGSPNAFAIVHTTKLCGAAVAYLFSKKIRKEILGKELEEQDDPHLELAALGTIADMVPLTHANRAVALWGLKALQRTNRLGLKALFKEAIIDPSSEISSYHVGHLIAPRLNASGRLESAMDSLRLICTQNRKRAEELAYSLSSINKERQDIMRDQSLHAIDTVRSLGNNSKKILVISHESYKEGVIGLIAGKLVEEFYRPAIVISERETHSKASVRSVKGFNIIEFLRSHSTMFINVGGHPMAAGFTIETKKITELASSLELSAEKLITDDILRRTITVDMELSFSDITDKLFSNIKSLEPFGVGNSEPIFVTRAVKVDDSRVIGREGKHLKLRVSKDGTQFDVIAFGMGERGSEISNADKVDIVYSIDENVWNGRRSLQLKLKDFRKDV